MRKLLTAALALASLMVASPAPARTVTPGVPPLPDDGTYLLRGELPESLIYLRLPDGPQVDGRVKVWQVVVLRDPDERSRPPARYIGLQVEFDCVGRRMRPVNGLAYSIDGVVVESEPRSDAWQDAKPRSNAAFDLDLVCTGQPVSGDANTQPLAGRAGLISDFKSRLGL